MLNLVKIISTRIDQGKRLIKFLKMGINDVQEMNTVQPFGIDGNPRKDMIALYAPTGEQGKAIIIGYINKNQVAAVGETRLYSTESDSDTEKFYIHLKNDGTAEVGGDSDFMVRFTTLESGFNQFLSDHNTHVHVGNMGAPTAPPTIPSSATIAGAKITEIKTL